MDTNVFIYHIGDIEPYSRKTESLLEKIQSGAKEGVTSVLTLLELNVRPYQLKRPEQALAHLVLFKNFPQLSLIPVSLEISDRAAQIRAQYNLKTPDALHVATALVSRCEVIIGNDRRLRRVREIPYILLQDLT